MMARRWLISGLLATAAFAQIHAAVAQSTSPTFPRLGGYVIGGNSTGMTAAHAAALDVMALAAYVGWTNNQGQNANQLAAAAKAINPNFRMFVYTDIMEDTNPPSILGQNNTQMMSVPWWALTAWPGGSLVSTGGGRFAVNITTHTNLLNGQNYPQWRAAKDFTSFLSGKSSLDGLYVDNVNYQPSVTADFTQSGSSQSPGTGAVTWRQGYGAYFAALRALSPSNQKLIIGNVATWLPANTITEYVSPSPVMNGGVMEAVIGQSYSVENFAGWSGMMAYYTHVMASVAAPKLMIFAQDAISTTDYQGFRYGFASCLLGDGYYYSDNAGNYNDFLTYDEFSFNLGTANVPALVFPGAAAYQNGVYRRDFANGIVLVNPKGNGTRTVTLETSYKHLSGTQAPSINNGQTVTSVTLNDRDGVILQRLTSQPLPDAPSLSVQ
jgi:Hypothetical glycosyl hydrolase family 15